MPVTRSPPINNPSKTRKIADTSFDKSDISLYNMSAMETEPNDQFDPNDVPGALLKIMQQLSLLTKEVTSVSSKLDSIEVQLENHNQEILEIKQANANTNQDMLNMKGRINVLEQKEFDCDLVIGGFMTLPGESEVTELCKHYKIARGSISHYFGFQKRPKQNSNNNQSQNFNLVLSFSSKFNQMAFRTSVGTLGKVTMMKLSGNSNSRNSGGNLITVSNRYTLAFRSINWKLGLLKTEGRIHAIKYRNCCIHVQENDKSKFVPVSTSEWLDSYTENLKQITPNMASHFHD